jgi:hypothetical protein
MLTMLVFRRNSVMTSENSVMISESLSEIDFLQRQLKAISDLGSRMIRFRFLQRLSRPVRKILQILGMQQQQQRSQQPLAASNVRACGFGKRAYASHF